MQNSVKNKQAKKSLRSIADHMHYFMDTFYPSGELQHDNSLCNKN